MPQGLTVERTNLKQPASYLVGRGTPRRCGVNGLFWASASPSSASDPVRSIELPVRQGRRFRDVRALYVAAFQPKLSRALLRMQPRGEHGFTCLFHLPALLLCLVLLRSPVISYKGKRDLRVCLHALTADRSTTELRWI
jgi:hypothetical protein